MAVTDAGVISNAPQQDLPVSEQASELWDAFYRAITHYRDVEEPFDPESILYRGWKRKDNFDGYGHAAYDIPSLSEPKNLVTFLPGCNSSPTLFPRPIHVLRKSGQHIFGIPPVKRAENYNNIETNKAMNTWLLTDARSPLRQDFDSTLPRAIFTNSANTYYTYNTLRNPWHAEKVLREWDPLIINAAPFADTAGASICYAGEQAGMIERVRRALISGTYGGYATLPVIRDTALGDAFMDKIVLGLRGAEKTLEENLGNPHFRNPTHGEGIELRKNGRRLISQLEEMPEWHPLRYIRQISYISENDPAASPRAGKYMAGLTGARIETCHAEHNPVPKIIRSIVEELNGAAANRRHTPAVAAVEHPGVPAL